MGLIPDEVRVVYFDAVGTLIFPDPPVAEAYHAVGQRYGSRLTVEEVRRGFYAAFAAQERLDAAIGYRTDQKRERARWRAIVAEAIPDAADPEGCFADLYDHFGAPEHWRVDPAAPALLLGLAERDLRPSIASNFDERLLDVVNGKSELALVFSVLFSEDIGWRKPASQFFARMRGRLAPNQVLLVGDDRVNDYDGARAAGLHAVLLDDTTTLTDLLP